MMVIDALEDEEHTVELELTVRDLTCICPVNGQTDTFTVRVNYHPMRGRVLELGAFRALLEGYRDSKITHEALTLDVLTTLVEQIQPAQLDITTIWAPVEGVECVVRVAA